MLNIRAICNEHYQQVGRSPVRVNNIVFRIPGYDMSLIQL